MTSPTHLRANRSSASGPVRGAWAVLAVFLLAWTVLEMVNHGGGTIPLGIAGFIAPCLTRFFGPAGPHEPGQLPRGRVPAYNLVHRPIGPVLVLVVVPFLPGDGPGANVGLFTFGLAWLLHIAADRALGHGLRTADGRQR
ncbi:membrane protein [Streptomyces spiroverticillatus]|nr:membrane protein [Streptomyces spiroverticillatus]